LWTGAGSYRDAPIPRVEPGKLRIVIGGDSASEGCGMDMSKWANFPWEYKFFDQNDGSSMNGLQGWPYYLH